MERLTKVLMYSGLFFGSLLGFAVGNSLGGPAAGLFLAMVSAYLGFKAGFGVSIFSMIVAAIWPQIMLFFGTIALSIATYYVYVEFVQ